MDKKIKVLFYMPSKFAIKVSVPPNKRFYEIFSSIPSKDMTFIYKGKILLNNQTVKSVGFNEGDCIVLIFKKNLNQNDILASQNNPKYLTGVEHENLDDDIQKWKDYTRKENDFNEKMRSMTSHGNYQEASRLKDLHWQKLELKKRFYQKLYHANEENPGIFGGNYFMYNKIHNSSLVTDYEVNTHPSTDPLPIFFV